MKGKVIFTTQPKDQAAELLRLLKERGALAFNLPMIETRTLALEKNGINILQNMQGVDLLIFTSRKGVKGFFENLKHTTGSFALPSGLKIAVVGNTTGAALEEYGHAAHLANPGNDAKALSEYLLNESPDNNNNILLALGNLAPDFLQNTLAPKATVQRINVYETLPVKEINPELAFYIHKKKLDICIFTSPSGFFAFQEKFEDIQDIPFAAIGNTTATAIKNAGYQVDAMATRPDAKSIVEAIEEYFNKKKL